MSIFWILSVRYLIGPYGISDVTAIVILGLALGLDLVIGFNIWKEWT